MEGFRRLEEAGHFVQIATSPWWSNPTCLQDKADWVARHLGEDARSRMVLTSDKTVIQGDYLIDDKPQISGAKEAPTWKQIVFDQPYNQDNPSLRLYSWSQIDEMLDIITGNRVFA